jgi:hypothetical protein
MAGGGLDDAACTVERGRQRGDGDPRAADEVGHRDVDRPLDPLDVEREPGSRVAQQFFCLPSPPTPPPMPAVMKPDKVPQTPPPPMVLQTFIEPDRTMDALRWRYSRLPGKVRRAVSFET